MTQPCPDHPVGCAVMAAGNAARYGENKLLARLNGRRLIDYALEAVPRELCEAVAVVTQYDEIAALAEEYGFACLRNDHPEWGASYTVRLAVEALAPTCGAILFQPADQPFLTRELLGRMIGLSRDDPDMIIALGNNGRRGSPCLFPKRFFPALTALRGDRGGSQVIREHPNELVLIEAGAQALMDIDEPDTLAELQE